MPLNSFNNKIYIYSSSRPVVFNVANNVVGGIYNYYGGRITLNVQNAFGVHPSNTELLMGNDDSSTISILELSGNNLNIASLVTQGVNATNGIITNNSATSSDFRVNQSIQRTYAGTLAGNINLIKQGSATLTLSAGTNLGVTGLGPRYTGFTAISAGTLRNYALSSNPSNKVSDAQFLPTSLVVNFTTPLSIGDSFILLPGRTINLYPAVTLQNASGRTGTYNSTNSTLSIT